MIGNHILSNFDPQKLYEEVELFCGDKKGVVKHYGSQIIPSNQGLIPNATCYIQWETTEEEFTTFRNRLQLMLGKTS